MSRQSSECKKCKGSGKSRQGDCATCLGSGRVFIKNDPNGGVAVTPAPKEKQ